MKVMYSEIEESYNADYPIRKLQTTRKLQCWLNPPDQKPFEM